MSRSSISHSSQQPLVPHDNIDGSYTNNVFMRDPSTISTGDIGFPRVLTKDDEVEEQTVMQVEFVNPELQRKKSRSEWASKNQCLTRRWQTALVIGLVLLGLGIGIGGLAYWISLPKVITQPFSLYNASCYMNSRSCDATRMLWCPVDRCICVGDFQWNVTAQNCSCGQYQMWDGLRCKNYGYFGDPCNPTPCRPTLTCSLVINQTCTTGQDICVCDNSTYLDTTTTSATYRTCIPRLSYGVTCKTNGDCQNWFGLACGNKTGVLTCQCGSTSYWNGSLCVSNALGWQPCSSSIPCDTTRGLSCASTNSCQCDQYSYWDNITTLWCQAKKTYAVSCQYTFQCNTTVNLSCPTTSTGCSCPTTSQAGICDCQSQTFWDGQRCINWHSFNGTCPGQYACSSNLVCYLGHCICPGNMVWNVVTANTCACWTNTTWNNVLNTCA